MFCLWGDGIVVWLHVLDYYIWDAKRYCTFHTLVVGCLWMITIALKRSFPGLRIRQSLCVHVPVLLSFLWCSPLIHSCAPIIRLCNSKPHYALYVLAGREWSHVITRTCLNWAVATINSTWSTSSSPRCLSTTRTRDSPLWPESAFMWVQNIVSS